MTVKELKDLLNQFPDHWAVRHSEDNQDYCTEIYEVREMTAPKFNYIGEIIGEHGIGEVELLTK